MNLRKMSEDRLKSLICLTLLNILLCANFVLPAAVTAQETRRLTPDEAVQLAINSNLSLESTRIGNQTKKRASNLSWNQFIPNVTVAGSVMRDNEATTVSGFAPLEQIPLNSLFVNPMTGQSLLPPEVPNFYGVVPYSVEISPWAFAASIQTSLNLNAAMFENMRRLKLDYETGILGYEKAKAQLERDIRKMYHSMLLLQENIGLLRVSFENVERQVQMAQANYNAGLAPELTLLQAQVARENMRPTIDQAENGLKLSMAQFAMYLGLPYDTAFELVDVTETIDFIPLDVAEMIKQASSKRPDILELRHTIMMLESARRTQILSLTPTLSLSWNYNSALVDPWNTSWFNSDTTWRKSGSFTISLAARLHSLIPFSTDFQSVRNLTDQIRTTSIGLAQLINGTEIEIYNIVLALERTRVSAEAQAQTVSIAEHAYQLTEQAYRAGLQDYFQVQNAQQSLNQAQVQMLEQHFNYINGLIDLEYAIGVPFGTLSGRSR